MKQIAKIIAKFDTYIIVESESEDNSRGRGKESDVASDDTF
jgi:hypothetical protein